MANSLYKVHELMVKAGVELEDIDKKHIASIAEKAGDLLSKGMVGAANASFDEIGEILNKKLREAGKEPLVFTNLKIDNKTLDNMVSMFADRISSGVAASIKDGIKEGFKSAKGSVPQIDFGMDDQLKKLKEDRQKLLDEYEKTKKLLKNKTKINEINNILGEDKLLTLTGDLKQHTDGFVKQFEEAVKKMRSVAKGTDEYDSAVLDAQMALDKLGAIQSEWNKKQKELKETDAKYHKVLSAPITKANIEKEAELKAKLDQLKSLNIDKHIHQLSKLKLSDDAQDVMIAFGDISDRFDEISVKLEDIASQIKEVNYQINEIENNNGTLKTLEEIEKAYDRILKKRGSAKEKSGKEQLESAIKYDGKESLTTLGNRYRASNLAGESWEEQYIWLVKFVKEYQSILEFNKTADKNHRKKISPGHKELYNQLLPMYADAEKSLNDLWAKVSPEQSGDSAKQNAVAQDTAAKAMQEQADAAGEVAEEEKKIVKDAEVRVEAEQKIADAIDKQKRSLDKIGDTYKKNILPGVTKEIAAQLDSKSGDFNRLVIGDATQVEDHNNFITDYDSFTGKYKEHYDTDYHTHPTDVAAPSMKDLARYQQSSNSGYQQRAVIQAMKEALFLDFSSLNTTAIKELIAEYGAKSAQIQGEFLAKYGEDRDPTSENNQQLAVALKNAFLEVVQKYPGVATYIDHEMPRYDSAYDRYKELPSEIQEIVKELAKLDKINEEEKDWNVIDAKEKQLASLDPGLGRIIGSEQYLEMLDKISVGTDTYNDATKAIQEETAAQEELNRKKKESADIPVPSEDDIKGGKALWRGVPIQYNASLPGEARNLTDFMQVGEKFFTFDEESQKSILDHEVAHNIADRLMKQGTDEWNKLADIFAPKKQLPKGANPSFYTEEDDEGNRWYREGLYGDLGATALSETLTHALTEYFSNPDAFKKRSEGAFNYLEEYLNKSGDTLDNVSAVKEELSVQKELNAAKQEEQRIEQESSATRAEASLDKLDELSDKAYDETDADALNKMLQERKAILDSIDESVRPDYADEIESHQQINAELEKRLSLLRDAQNGLIDVYDIDDVIKETGTLESKLERLDDVSYDWGMKIKDGEEDDAIDELEAFEETYDRIVLKLANGKKIEILPNAKGLRQLNKYQDGLDHSAYGETEIEDVIFERKKKEIAVQEDLNAVLEEQQQIEQPTDTVVAENQKKIESYEELKQALQEYYDVSSKIKRIEWNEKDEKWLGIEGVRFPDGASDEPEKYFKQQWKRVSLIRKSIKDGADSYIDPELKTAVRIQENTLEKEMQELEAYATQFTLNVEGFSDAQKKFVNEINQKYDKWIQQNEVRYAELDKYNKPYEDSAHEIDSLIGKQLKDPNDMKSYSTFMRALSNVKQYGVTEQSLKIISNLIGVEVPQAAETAKQAVDGLNTSLEKQQHIERADSSSAQVAEEKAETTAIEQQNEALKENLSLKQMIENAESGTHGQSLADVGGVTVGTDTTVGANMQELQNVLSNITYSVKIVNDDTDKTANKIALDDSSLEATLNRVFANIINPTTEQNDVLKSVLHDGTLYDVRIAEDNSRLDLKRKAQNMTLGEFLRDTDVQKLMNSKGITQEDQQKDFWKQSRYDKDIAFYPLSRTFAENTIAAKVPKNLRDMWYFGTNLPSDVRKNDKFAGNDIKSKASLEELILGDDELRNAALNYMWHNYNAYNNDKVGFQDFLNTPRAVYRGMHGTESPDELLSYSFDKKVAERISENVVELMVKPRDTVGSVAPSNTLSEQELWVRNNGAIAAYQPDNIQVDNNAVAQAPWALESTLKTVKGVLDTIQNNTSKIGTTEVATVVDDEVLSAIKQAVESINHKIVQGTKVLRTSSNKKTEEKSADLEIKNPKELGNVKATKVDSRVKALESDYARLGKLQADFAQEGSAETAEEIRQLQELVQHKKEELKLEQDKQTTLDITLEKRRSEAEQAEKAILVAREADQARKQAAKDEKADLKARLRRSKEENRFGASTTAWNSGNKALESLWKIDESANPLEHKSVQDLMSSLKELNDVRQRVNESIRKGIEISEEDSNELRNKTTQVAMHTEAVKQLVSNYDELSGANAQDTGHVFGGGNLESQLKGVIQEVTNGKARIGDFDAATGRLKYTVQTGMYEFKEYEMAVRDADGAIVSLQKSTKRTETFFESFKRKLSELTRYFSASSLIYKFFNELRKGIQYVREIDLALVELRKVTDKTEEEYDEFLNTASKTANKLGSTISAVTEATATFAKLGYSMEMAAEMAEAAIVYKNVGDNIASTEDAADSIISTLKGFGLEASESMRIVDRFNEVGNKFAITSQGIGEALRLSASALNEGGNTLDESIGLITAANEVVNDPSSVGTALKTLTLRLRGSKTELEEMGEDVSDMATTTSQLQAKLLALTGGQVDIMLDENTFKSSAQILREMAAAWESMTDIERASALELMGGKRQANVLSALISNFDTAEKAIEASANSAGSALRENEVYLDSIQGRIDLFTNSVQTMWKNALDSDVVKWFVDFGTQLVKVVDTLGLIPSILLAIGAYKGLSHLFTGFDIVSWIRNMSTLTMGTKIFEAETRNATLSLVGEQLQLNLANSALVQYAVKMGLATSADVAKMTTTQLLGLSFKALTTAVWGATKAVIAFLFTNPVGWVILAIGAIAGGIAIFNHFHKTTEELTEELNELKNELQDIKSELDSVNSELETTQDRIAELLAMDSLSFTEKEELKNLQKENDELERRLDLLEQEKKNKLKQSASKAVKTFDSTLSDEYYVTSDALNPEKSTGWGDFIRGASQQNTDTIARGDMIYALMTKYQEEIESGNTETAAKYATLIDKTMKPLKEAVDGFEYGISPEMDEAIDIIRNMEDEWNIVQGAENAKSNAIKRIFNKDEYSDELESIENYLEALENGDASAAKSIAKIIKNNDNLTNSLEAVGLSADDAIDYFTSLASTAAYNTVEGKMAETTEAANRLSKALSGNFDTASFNDLGKIQQVLRHRGWVDGEGELLSDAIAEYFGGEDGGISEETRAEIERLVKQIYDGKLTIEDALTEFELFSVKSTLDIYIGEVKTNFKDVFVDLEEVDGLINTFEELGEAIGSAANALDTLNQAQAEMAYSGQVSIETALQLMEYTDDYGSVLTVVDGKLQLVDGAEDALIETRIASIKTSAEAALRDAELASQKAWLAVEEYKSAMQTEASTNVVSKAWDNTLAKAAGFAAGITSLFTDESWSEAYDNAYNEAMSKVTEYETQYTDDGLQALVDAAEEADKDVEMAKDNYDLAQNLTADSLKGVYDSDEASGGTNNKKDAEEKKVEDEWEKLINKYENELALITNERDLIEAEIDKAEARGGKASAKYYKDLIENSQDEKTLLEEKYKALNAYLQANEDAIDPETWTEYNNELNETAIAIKECEANTIEWVEAIREIDQHYFEQTTDAISNLGEEIDFVNGLLEDEEVADENGNWSSAALTRIGLYTQQMEKAAAEAQLYQNEIDKLNTQFKNGEVSEEQYQEKLAELVGGQQDAIQSYEDAKDGIVELNEARIDAIKDGIEKEIEAYEDLIDLKKEELDAERDLYDFKKNVQKQTKDIATLERRIASLSGSTNASDIAERRKLQAELNEAREGLNDAYYERSHDQQSQALDDESEAFSESKEKYIEELEKQLEDTETLIQNSLMDMLLNADTVYAELNGITNTYGITLSKELTQPWKDASDQAITWKNELQESMTAGEYAALIGEGGAITAFANGVAMKLTGSWGSAKTAAQKYVDFLTKEELGSTFEKTITGFGTQIQSLVTYWNNVRSAAEAAHAEQERKVTVGGNPNVGGNEGSGGGNGTGGNNSGSGNTSPPADNPIDTDIERLQAILNQFFNAGLDIDGQYGPKTTAAVKAMQSVIGDIKDGLYTAATKSRLQEYLNKKNVSSWFKETGIYIPNALKTRKSSGGGGGSKLSVAMKYAKGTMGTSRDQWALTDEIGDELVLVPGANGNLSFMRKGTSVVPADITANLVEWGKLNPDMLKVGGGANINMISNAINKPEINLDIAEFLHVDKVDKDTMPELEKFVDKKMNDLVRQLNYSIKKFK